MVSECFFFSFFHGSIAKSRPKWIVQQDVELNGLHKKIDQVVLQSAHWLWNDTHRSGLDWYEHDSWHARNDAILVVIIDGAYKHWIVLSIRWHSPSRWQIFPFAERVFFNIFRLLSMHCFRIVIRLWPRVLVIVSRLRELIYITNQKAKLKRNQRDCEFQWEFIFIDCLPCIWRRRRLTASHHITSDILRSNLFYCYYYLVHWIRFTNTNDCCCCY